MSSLEQASSELPAGTRASISKATAAVHGRRLAALQQAFPEIDAARRRAAAIKDHVIEHLPELLCAFEAKASANGMQVHWARDGEEACRLAVEILGRFLQPGDAVAKAKSMVTEEIHLNQALEAAGWRPVETDLGEHVIQLDGDTPSHIVAPIIHRSRQDVAKTFRKAGYEGVTDDPSALAMLARARLREEFRQAPAGVSGVNFAIVESGRLVIVENEGNNRLSTTAPRVHVAFMGIERLLPSDADIPLFLRLLAGSATGQSQTVYTHLVQGPAPDGPEEVHVILVDNGRSALAAGPFRSLLRCIRCGACLNVCPVYRQAGGHSYGGVYSGPIGAALDAAKGGSLAQASSLCGACEEVCPVAIPIPDLLVLGRTQSPARLPGVAAASSRPWMLRLGASLLPFAGLTKPGRAWEEKRDLPSREGRDFRRWWNDRS